MSRRTAHLPFHSTAVPGKIPLIRAPPPVAVPPDEIISVPPLSTLGKAGNDVGETENNQCSAARYLEIFIGAAVQNGLCAAA